MQYLLPLAKSVRALAKNNSQIGKTRTNGNLIFEIESMGNGVRSGEISGVKPTALDSCKVCLEILGPNANVPQWMQQWINMHDGYDELHCGRGALSNSEETSLMAGNLCGKYCCVDMPSTDMIQ